LNDIALVILDVGVNPASWEAFDAKHRFKGMPIATLIDKCKRIQTALSSLLLCPVRLCPIVFSLL
jgi:hypothetical protein